MDIVALIKAGRHAEVIAELEPKSRLGDWSSSNNLAVVYRQIGDKPRQLFYAQAAYHQAPHSPTALNTLFRALHSAEQHRLITQIYSALPNHRGLDRNHHLNAALAYIRINRTDQAQAALARAADYPLGNAADLEAGILLAGALSQSQEVLRLLDALGQLGVEVRDRRATELFTAGDMEGALAALKAGRTDGQDVKAMAKTALLAAITLGDRDEVTRLAADVAGGIRRFAQFYLAGTQDIEVQGQARAYRFPFEPDNFSIALQHALGKFYEAESLALIGKLLSPGDLVVDVGANIGNHAVYFAGEAGCRVIALECNPALVPKLARTVAMTGLESQIDLSHVGAAVSDAVGEMHFNFIRSDFSNVSAQAGARTTQVPAITLDSLGLAACRLLKIDVDGGEVAVLRGAETLLRTLRPVVAVEVLNFNTTAVLELMAGHGYEIVREDAAPTAYGDFIFAPKEMPLPTL